MAANIAPRGPRHKAQRGGQRMVNQLKTGDRQGSTHSRSDVQPIIHLDIRKIPFTDLGINMHIVEMVRISFLLYEEESRVGLVGRAGEDRGSP